MDFIAKHILELTAVFYIVLFFTGLAAWYCNGIGLTKFDLNFIWQGISTLFGAGVFSSIKYIADSCKNSEQGQNPYQQLFKAVDKNS